MRERAPRPREPRAEGRPDEARAPRAVRPAAFKQRLGRLAAATAPERQLALDLPLSDEERCEEAFAAIAAGKRAAPEGLERLGASDAFADVILGLLRVNGWTVLEPTPFAGDGVLLIATCDWREVRADGPTFCEATVALVSRISTYYGVEQKRLSA